MARISGKNMQLWVSTNTTPPTVSDAVSYVTGINWSSRANVSNVTAAGDTAAVKVGGIPDGNLRVTGRWDNAAASDLVLAAHQAQDVRACTLVWDTTTSTEQLDFEAIVADYGQTGSSSGPWDFSATLEITGAITETRA